MPVFPINTPAACAELTHMSKVLFLLTILFACCFPSAAQVTNGNIEITAASKAYNLYRLHASQGWSLAKGQNPDSACYRHFYRSVGAGEGLPVLPQGHYLQVSTEATTISYRYFFITDFNVYVLDNSTDLMIQLRDKLTDDIKEDAVLSVGNISLPFDKATGTYRIARSYDGGALRVLSGNDTFSYDLSHSYEKPKPANRNWLFSKPLRYLTLPLYYRELLPRDLYLTAKYGGRPQGALHHVVTVAQKLYTRLAGHRQYAPESYYTYQGFFFFSKPKYRAGDSIRFNALLQNSQTHRWREGPLVAVFNNHEQWIVLDTLRTSGGGGYHYTFLPPDSFRLKLDRDYTIALRNMAGTELALGSFHYESYELKKTDFAIAVPEKKEHLKGSPFVIGFKAKDKNGLPMPDTRAEVYVCRGQVGNVSPSRLFIPDTLAVFRFGITDGTFEFPVNDSIFPDADMSYNLHVFMKNAVFEAQEGHYSISYSREKAALKMDIAEDRLIVQLLHNDSSVAGRATLQATDAFGYAMPDTCIALPYSGPVNPHVYSYRCFTEGGVAETLPVERAPAQLEVSSTRDDRHIRVQVLNPRKLAFTWQFSCVNEELERGQGNTLDRSFDAAGKDRYYLQLQYVWAGRAAQLSYEMPLPENQVFLTVDQPDNIYPGKETTVTVTARDYRNKPLRGIHIFSYGLNAAFDNIYNPQLPLPPSVRPVKTAVNSFQVARPQSAGSLRLDYNLWRNRFGLDSLYSYRFLYPSARLEMVTTPTPDSSTQVAPFIVSGGVLQPVRYVLLDNQPVWFGFTDVRLPYSFRIDDTLYHQMAIQTDKDYIFIDSLRPAKHRKSLFSIDVRQLPANVYRSGGDRNLHFQQACISYNTSAAEGAMSYLRHPADSDKIYLLPPNTEGDYQGITFGPVGGTDWIMGAYGVYEQELHTEPGFTYQPEPGLMRMIRNAGDAYNDQQATLPGLNDFALNPAQLRDSLRRSNRVARQQFTEFSAGPAGSQALVCDLEPVSSGRLLNDTPLYYVVLSKNDPGFARIYTQPFSQLEGMPPGAYELFFIGKEHRCYSAGIAILPERGYTFYRADKITATDDPRVRQLDALLRPAGRADDYLATTQRLFNHFQQYAESPLVMIIGEVKGSNGRPVEGAAVDLNDDGAHYVYTDFNGRFSMTLTPRELRNGRLHVRYGYVRRGRSYSAVATVKPVKNLSIDLDTKGRAPAIDDDSQDYSADLFIAEGAPTYSSDAPADVQINARSVTRYTSTDSKSITSAEVASMRPVSSLAPASYGTPGIALHSSGGRATHDIQVRGSNSLAGGGPIVVLDGALYGGSLQSIDPAYIETMLTLRGAEATALYGARGANGVLVVTTKKGMQLPSAIRALTTPVETLPEVPDELMVSGLRSHFSDEAFWQPALRTDKDGQVRFNVKFPDDMTAWKTFVYATGNKQNGQASGLIRSFKPLSAILSTPRFLVSGDSAYVQGKAVLYKGDTATVNISFYQNDTLAAGRRFSLSRYAIDSFLLCRKGEGSVKMKYMLEGTGGYFDGEEKSIPVLRKGTPVAEGAFVSLDGPDTAIRVMPEGRDSLYLSATASLVDLIVDEVKILKEYKYLCNEQLSSKILGVLTQQRLYKALRRDFSDSDRHFVQEMVDLLAKRQQGRELWGWWSDGAASLWISARVVQALSEARKLGYQVNVDFTGITQQLVRSFERDTSYTELDALQLIHTAGLKIDFGKYLARYERKHPSYSLADRLRIARLRKDFGLPADLAFLKTYATTDIFGNVYWKDTARYVYHNEVINTVNGLLLLSGGKGGDVDPRKVVNWLLQQRRPAGWRNTYESALIIEALAAYVPLGDSAAMQPVLDFSGALTETVSNFPYRKALSGGAELNIRKTGASPVYFTWYQRKWDTSASGSGNNFRIRSVFVNAANDTIQQLSAGKPFRLEVSVHVAKDAEFVMIDVPVPASCSYASKAGKTRYEVHREYFEDHVSIFCEKLPEGDYTYSIELLPRYTGSYTLNPARAELMYFPVFYGKEGLKRVRVE